MFGISLEKVNLVFKACCENIQWCKNTCYLEVGKACENIHLSKNTEYWVNVPIGLQSSLQLTYTTVLTSSVNRELCAMCT